MPTAVVTVPIKPPALAAAGLALGLCGKYLAPGALPDIIPGAGLLTRLCVSLPLGAAGLLFLHASREELGRHGVHPRFRPVRQLVTTGPFSLSRNPMYVGAAALLVALALAANSAWLLLAMLAPFLAYLQLLVIPREEQALAAAFGQQYSDYAQHTPRWLWCAHHRWLRH